MITPATGPESDQAKRFRELFTKRFPIMATNSITRGSGYATIPWSFIQYHEDQALKNHGQTLHRLAERGGLCWSEALAVLTDRVYWHVEKMKEEECAIEVAKLCEYFIWRMAMAQGEVPQTAESFYLSVHTEHPMGALAKGEIPFPERPCVLFKRIPDGRWETTHKAEWDFTPNLVHVRFLALWDAGNRLAGIWDMDTGGPCQSLTLEIGSAVDVIPRNAITGLRP